MLFAIMCQPNARWGNRQEIGWVSTLSVGGETWRPESIRSLTETQSPEPSASE